MTTNTEDKNEMMLPVVSTAAGASILLIEALKYYQRDERFADASTRLKSEQADSAKAGGKSVLVKSDTLKSGPPTPGVITLQQTIKTYNTEYMKQWHENLQGAQNLRDGSFWNFGTGLETFFFLGGLFIVCGKQITRAFSGNKNKQQPTPKI